MTCFRILLLLAKCFMSLTLRVCEPRFCLTDILFRLRNSLLRFVPCLVHQSGRLGFYRSDARSCLLLRVLCELIRLLLHALYIALSLTNNSLHHLFCFGSILINRGRRVRGRFRGLP